MVPAGEQKSVTLLFFHSLGDLCCGGMRGCRVDGQSYYVGLEANCLFDNTFDRPLRVSLHVQDLHLGIVEGEQRAGKLEQTQGGRQEPPLRQVGAPPWIGRAYENGLHARSTASSSGLRHPFLELDVEFAEHRLLVIG